MSDISVSNYLAPESVGEGYLLFVKKACETCAMLLPVYRQLQGAGVALKVIVQDEPEFYGEFSPIDDRRLESSFRYDIETVPTLVKVRGGKEVGREFGWQRAAWQELTGQVNLGAALPSWQPGCGSKSREPGVHEHLVEAFGVSGLQARRFEIDHWDDPVERCYEQGWTDGLPVVPPTDARILRMLSGTARRSDEIVGKVPPNLTPCSVEKVAINAVLAGCKPEYMPVLLAALETALEPVFTMHGLLCTTCFSGPIIVVNGPVARRIGMNWGINALGQGNRANATIGRALQLIIRNVGGGIPGELDRATLGGPGKYTFCFAEDETDSTWEPLSVARGIAPGKSAVTLFQGDGIQGFIDQRSRTPQELTRSFASALVAVGHPKLAQFTNAMLVLSAEHYEIYKKAGWNRKRITDELHAACVRPAVDLVQGAHGVGEGVDPKRKDEGSIPKFWDDGLLIVRAGGQAGLFSAILCGWTGGRFRDESKPVTREIKE